jgi:hypothetical protein
MKNEIRRTCNTHTGDKKCLQKFGPKTWQEAMIALENYRRIWKVNTETYVNRMFVRMWIGFTWLKQSTAEGFLVTTVQNFRLL